MVEQFVIVGAGLAGARAAEALRDEGFEGRIVLIGAEPHRPYERPPLSKGQLLGTEEPEAAFVHPGDWYTGHAVDFRPNCRAEEIDRTAHTVRLSTGDSVHYDRLLLATGSAPVELRTPGAKRAGVHYLRTLDESARIAAALAAGQRLVVIGGGWIGLEVAAAARQRGAEVSLVEVATLPLLRVLGLELAERYAELHRSRGVTFHLGAAVERLIGSTEDGPVTGVVLGDGSTLPADLVVVGVGIRPETGLAAAAGLDIDNGIVTGPDLRTSDPDIFACGDVANSFNPVLGHAIRVEHWDNANEGGRAAARSMLGQSVSYDHLPYFYSDQYHLGMEYCGYAAPGGYDRVIFRGDASIVDGKAPEFLAFWLNQGRVVAAMNANIWDVQDDLRKLVRAGFAGQAADPDRLTNPDIALSDVLG